MIRLDPVVGRVLLWSLLGLWACGSARPAETETARATEGPAAPRAEGYAGSDACAECHEDEHERWRRSLHPTMLSRADAPSAVPRDVPPPVGVSLDDAAFVVAGRHLKRFVGRDAQGLYLLPVQYSRAEKRWAPWKPGRAGERDRYSYSELCAGCHTTGGRPERGRLGELGVGCEACHGPSRAHANEPTPGDLLNLASLPPERALMVCGQCHTAGSDPSGRYWYPVGFRPGDDLERFYRHAEPAIGDVERSWPTLRTAPFWPDGSTAKHRQQYLDLRRSEHAREGLSCTACHDPHGPATEGEHFAHLIASPRSLCGRCHDAQARDERHGHHEGGQVTCVECHMPKLGFMGRPNANADHVCRVPDPAESERLSTPSACVACHAHADRDDRWAADALSRMRAAGGGPGG